MPTAFVVSERVPSFRNDFLVQSLLVVEADPAEHVVFGVLEGRETGTVDELALEGRDSGLGHRVDAPIVK
jgi:hypothetical protein